MAMRAYEALSKGNSPLAIDLSNKLKEMNSNIAAPHIIEGLAQLKLGNKKEASSSFEKARSLDPSDADVTKLIEISK